MGTNRLLFFLSQYPADGMTIRQLQEQAGEGLSKDQIVSLLEGSAHAHKKPGAGKGGPTSNLAHVWSLRRYILGSGRDDDLRRRVSSGGRES